MIPYLYLFQYSCYVGTYVQKKKKENNFNDNKRI